MRCTCYITTNDTASSWWLDRATAGQMASPQPEGNHTHVIHYIFTPLIHSFHLFPWWRPRPVRCRVTFLPTRSHLFSAINSQSSSSASLSPFFFLLHPKKERPLQLSVSSFWCLATSTPTIPPGSPGLVLLLCFHFTKAQKMSPDLFAFKCVSALKSLSLGTTPHHLFLLSCMQSFRGGL